MKFSSPLHVLMFFNIYSCIYLYHRYTGQLLGYNPNLKFENGSFEVPTPVSKFKYAIDWDIGNPKNSNHTYLTLKNQKNNKALDVKGGSNSHDALLILWPYHGNKPQQFRLNLLKEKTFSLVYQDMCIVYNENKNSFMTGKCKDLSKSSFSIYTKVNRPGGGEGNSNRSNNGKGREKRRFNGEDGVESASQNSRDSDDSNHHNNSTTDIVIKDGEAVYVNAPKGRGMNMLVKTGSKEVYDLSEIESDSDFKTVFSNFHDNYGSLHGNQNPTRFTNKLGPKRIEGFCEI